MKLRNLFLTALAALGLFTTGQAFDSVLNGVVNFSTCVTDSKYGKHEQTQFEKIRGQWGSMIEETEKELKDVSAKFEDQDYLDGLSPEAEEELKIKYRTLYEDMSRYQGQLSQILNQANYFLIQRMSSNIAKASESIARSKKLSVVINKEACFYNAPDLDVTAIVIKEMNKNYDQDVKDKKITENLQEPTAPIAENGEEKPVEPKAG